MSFLRMYFYFYQGSHSHKCSKEKIKNKFTTEIQQLLWQYHSIPTRTWENSSHVFITSYHCLLFIFCYCCIIYPKGSYFWDLQTDSNILLTVSVSLTAMPSFWRRTMNCVRRNFHQPQRVRCYPLVSQKVFQCFNLRFESPGRLMAKYRTQCQGPS